MWLLKKEEPLCPCCRRDFVSEVALNGERENTDEVGGAAEEGQEVEDEASARPPPQDPPRSERGSPAL